MIEKIKFGGISWWIISQHMRRLRSKWVGGFIHCDHIILQEQLTSFQDLEAISNKIYESEEILPLEYKI